VIHLCDSESRLLTYLRIRVFQNEVSMGNIEPYSDEKLDLALFDGHDLDNFGQKFRSYGTDPCQSRREIDRVVTLV